MTSSITRCHPNKAKRFFVILIIFILCPFLNYSMEGSLPELPNELWVKIAEHVVDGSKNPEKALCNIKALQCCSKQHDAIISHANNLQGIIRKIETKHLASSTSLPYLTQDIISAMLTNTPAKVADLPFSHALRLAYLNRNKRIARYFFLQLENQTEKDAAFHSCVLHNDHAGAGFCIKHTININSINNNTDSCWFNKTALMCAAQKNDPKMVKLLLAHGACKDIYFQEPTRKGMWTASPKTARDLALEKASTEIAKLLE